MDKKKQLIYLSALLHDIGKFYQRADSDGTTKSKLLSEKVKRLETVLCPEYNGRYTHKHVLWTAQYIEDISSHLNQYLGQNTDFSPDILLRTASAHHKPESFLEKIIQKADHYSSGADRSADERAWKDAVEEEDKKWDSFKRIRMRSIFETVSLSAIKSDEYEYQYRLPIKEISLKKEQYFPKRSGEDNQIPDYKILWENFTTEVKFIQSRSFNTFGENLLFLLEKYTSRIPSSTVHLPDVSLYDHAKTTAAFANCLHDYIVNKEYDKVEAIPGSDEQPFLLIGGDLSGIQKFIYDITAREAAKNLKGRSFYLQLLIDNIVHYILNKLELFDASVIYASGGGFYLLAPNTEIVKMKISEIEKFLSEKLYASHGTTLYLGMDYIPFGEKELYYKEGQRSISNVWMDLSKKLGIKKGQRYRHIIENNFEKLFGIQMVNPNLEKDYITGEELTGKPEFLDKENKKHPVNYSTWEQIKLGEKLKHTDYWILSKEKLTYFKGDGFSPIDLGYFNYFLKEEDVKNAEDKLKQSADKVRVIYFNKENFLDSLHKGIDNVYGFNWYGGNDYPENKFNEPKTFTELAGIEFDKPNWKEDEQKRASGPELARLGVLRMDVDNLGAVFRRGLPENKRSFSRYCTLSRSLDYFFKGYLNEIRKNNNDYEQYTQIIYAGGDDLFIVGKWDILAKMANDISNEFKEWTCHNPDLNLSGGMAIVGPKFPILKAASYSERFEQNAKKHRWKDKEKDSFSLFGYTIVNKHRQTEDILFSFNWENEYKHVIHLKDELKKLFQNGLPAGFAGEMYNLMQQASFRYNVERQKYEPDNYRIIWLTAYQFKRAMKESKDKIIKVFMDLWIKNIMTGKMKLNENDKYIETSYHSLQILALAARWATLEERSIIKPIKI